MPQASEEPLSTSAAEITAIPPDRLILIFLVNTVGGVTSLTVTVAVAVDWLPWLSVTVSVTVLTPVLLQSKLLLSILNDEIPQASLEPLSISEAVMTAVPAADRFISIFFTRTAGG